MRDSQTIRDRRLNTITLEYLDPDSMPEFVRDNKLTNNFAIVTAMNPEGLGICESTSGNVLKVANAGTGLEQYSVLNGQTNDNYNAGDTLNVSEGFSTVDITVTTNNAKISFRNSVTNIYGDDISVNIGFRSIDINSDSIQIKSAISGSAADYELIAYY